MTGTFRAKRREFHAEPDQVSNNFRFNPFGTGKMEKSITQLHSSSFHLIGSSMRSTCSIVALSALLFLVHSGNAENIQPSTAAAERGFMGYVIITTSDIIDASTELQNLVAQKTTEGFSVSFVTETVWGASTADERADNIRTWLKEHWEVDEIRYVLFIGNPDPLTGAVPMKLTYYDITVETASDRGIPTDFYYSELSGTWDVNGDGYFGDVNTDYGVGGGADQYGEIAVGRIPYYGIMEDLDHIIRKSIDYRNATDREWRKNALMAMTPTNEGNQAYPLGEAIKDSILIPGGRDYFRIYEPYNRYNDSTLQELYDLDPPVEHLGTTEAKVQEVWSASPFGYFIWWTHGTSTQSVGSIFRSSRAEALNDQFPTMVFQVSCSSAFPEDTNNLAYALLKNGAVAVAGPTRETNSYRGQTSFLNSTSNSGMGYTFTKYVIQDGMSVGDALLTVRANTTTKNWHPNKLTYSIYGCPDLKIDSEETTDVRHFTSISRTPAVEYFRYNPQSRQFTGNLKNLTGDCSVTLRVTDLAGRVIFRSTGMAISNGSVRFMLPSGMAVPQQTVIVSVSGGGRTVSSRVVIR